MRTSTAGAIIAIVSALVLTTFAARGAAQTAPAISPSRAHAEALFMRTVDMATDDANATVGNLQKNAGKHVAFDCWVEQVVRDGVMIGQCGNPDEPIDVYVELPTAGLHIDDHLRVLGVMMPPAEWSDVTGHPMYYAFLRAVFVDHVIDAKTR
jgi:hypothetical protein